MNKNESVRSGISAVSSKFAAIITAAGISQRIGTDKASLIRRDGKTFSLHLIEFYLDTGADPLIIVVNTHSTIPKVNIKSVKFVINNSPEKGRGYSIELAINQLPDGLPCFIQSVDNQYVDEDLVMQMLSAIDADSYCVPVCKGRGGHPVLLGSNIVRYIHSNGINPDLRELLSNFRRIEIQCNTDKVLLNINTPEDYRNYLSGSD
jgi:molybdenum cofactor cytidylyltransferase